MRDVKSRKPTPAEITPTKPRQIRWLIYAVSFVGAVVAAFVWPQSTFGKVIFELLEAMAGSDAARSWGI